MATTNRPTVVGVFEDRDDAERAVEALHRAGFRDDHIDFAAHGGAAPAGGTAVGRGSEAGEGAAKGAFGGGIIGAILGALATGLIPGIGPVIAGGLLAGIVGGAAVGAAGGGLLGALTGSMGVPEEEARYYDGEFRAGRTIVTVRADGRYSEAQSILRRSGAYDVENRRLEAAGGPRASTVADDGGRVELREEVLQPRTEPVESGAVRIEKDVVTEPRTVDVPVTREEVVVERRPVEPRPSERPISEGESIRVPVREEHVSLDKETVVTEEVEVGKRPVTETERVSGTVRREEARVEREGDVDVRGDEPPRRR